MKGLCAPFFALVALGASAAEKTDFVASNIEHVILHEFGHALVQEFDLPISGSEEIAADTFATLDILAAAPESAPGVLLNVAQAYVSLSDELGPQTAYARGAGKFRGFRAVCLLVGSGGKLSSAGASHFNFTEDQRSECAADFRTAREEWDGYLQPWRAVKPANRVAIGFAPAETALEGREALIALGILPSLAREFSDRFDWPRPLILRARECGAPNASWNAQIGTVEICYELVELFMSLDPARN